MRSVQQCNALYHALRSGEMAEQAQSSRELFILPDGTSVSDNAFFALASSMAHALVGVGAKPGDRIAVQVEKSVAALALYIACVQAGLVFLPLNTDYTVHELDYFLKDAEPGVFVVDPHKEDKLRELTNDNDVVLFTLSQAGDGSLIDAAEYHQQQFVTVARRNDDLVAILYTSGTTGRSKGAMLTQENLLSNARTLVEAWQFTNADVLLHALPIFHTHGLFVACNVIFIAGGRLLFQPSFNIDSIIQALPQASCLMGVPTFYTRLLADKRLNRSLVGHIRLFISGSAPLLRDTHRAFTKRTGLCILERYGMTETNMNTSNPYFGERIAGTVGLPLPGVEVRVLDQDSGEICDTGKIGMLHVRGPNVFVGYWRMPDKTRDELLEDGFFITGDLASIDTAGYVTIAGRDKDLIISAGYNIYPGEIELLLDAVPGVLESAVVGAPHADLGEAGVAVVVRENSAVGDALDETTLLESIKDKLARFKQPRVVVFVAHLPRNTMGKIQKKELRRDVRLRFT
ncbi:MAG: AMP-binding protein [Granulosicoccus sp.]